MIFIFTGKGHAQHAGVLTVFSHGEVVLQIVDHSQRGEFGHGELAALLGMNGAHHHADAIFRQHLAHFAARAESRIAGQLVLFRTQHRQGKGLIARPFRQHKVSHLYRIVASSHQAIPAGTKDREGIFGDGDIETEVVNRFPQYQT